MKKTIFSIFLTVACFIPNLLNAATLHLVVVYDNHDSITNPWKDKNKMLAFAEDAAHLTEMGLKTYIFTKDISEEAFKNEINSIKCESDDVLLLYYAGHGAGAGDKFPLFILDGNVAIDLTNFHNYLKNKNARLTITMYDTPNHGAGLLRALNTMELNTPILIDNIEERKQMDYNGISNTFQILLKKSKGDIMMCASLPRNFSFNNNKGEIFTQSFIKEFYQPQDTNTLTWQSFFQQIQFTTNLLAAELPIALEDNFYALEANQSTMQDYYHLDAYQIPYSEMQVTRDFPLIKGKEIGLQKIIYVESPEVEIGIRDNQNEDGDSISMVFQQKLFLENVELKNVARKINLHLNEGENQFMIVPENEGQEGLNTCAFAIFDGKKRQQYILKTKESQNVGIRIFYQPKQIIDFGKKSVPTKIETDR